MPLYDYKCYACQAKREVLLKIAELDTAVVHCLKCNNAMNRQLSAPMVVGDYPGYSCPITGKWVEGRRAHIENLKQHDCRVYEPGETEAFTKRKAKEDEIVEDLIVDNAIRDWQAMPVEKKDRLAAELVHGAEAPIIRQ